MNARHWTGDDMREFNTPEDYDDEPAAIERHEAEAIARRMIDRYHGARLAAGAAWDHAMSYERQERGRGYWTTIHATIRRLAAEAGHQW